MPAMQAPSTKVKMITLLISMPISAAASRSSDTARIAIPIFVFWTTR